MISINGFRLFRIPGLNLRILVQRIWLSSIQWMSCDDSGISPGSVYFGTSQVGFMVSVSNQVHIALPLRYPARRNKSKLMNPPNADILELKEMMKELFNVVQGFALGQKAIFERMERIEKWLITEKIQGNAPSSGVKKLSGNGQHKKEVESSGVHTRKEHGRDCYHPYAATSAIPAGNSSVQQQQPPPQQRAQKAGCQVKKGTTGRQFDKPPVTYTLLFKRLRDLGLVQPRILVPVELHRRPANYDENARCEFHSGAPGHHIEGCRAFKNVVQDLVDSKAINFAPTPEVNADPVPMHDPMGVNVMSEDKGKTEVTDVDQLRTSMSMVERHLMKSGAFPGCDNYCAAVATNGCAMMREIIQRMMEVEMGDEICETPCQAVETVKVENAIVTEKEKKPSISSYKQAMEVVKNGEALGWGKIIDIVVKADMLEVGYHPDQDSSGQNKGRRQPFPFISVGMLNLGHACTVGEEIDGDCELDSWIKSCVPGNWKASKIITVTHHEELARLLRQEEKVIQPHEERVEIVNPGTEEVRKEVKVGAALKASVKSRAKSQTEEGHVADLAKLFDRLRQFKRRLNSDKCTFRVRSGKLLGLIVSERGIEAARRLRQYMLVHTALWISKMDPIKYIFEKPALNGRVARGQMILTEYDIQYTSQKAIKGSVLPDYLAQQPIEDYQPMKFEFPDEDIMVLKLKDCEEPIPEEGPDPESERILMFDGVVSVNGSGVGVALVTPKGSHIARMTFECTNYGGGV
ncbi:hypothetical protein KIW84_012631 [Lathyrus oleraceus]|uniref:Uncharacterized protein n=1 Tax=Pisum sativum TaxID=3888 RepID=A0A9D5BIG2_PEA|nr:hypothetical protein KIW84_012631 [Pisum sativum]